MKVSIDILFGVFLIRRIIMSQTKKLTLSALFIAIGLVMPFITMQVPQIGSMLLPMHLPVLIGGFVLGGPHGALVGFITPLLRSTIFSMPPMATAIPMAFELATYGFVTGFVYRKVSKNLVGIYVALIIAMLVGRLVWGVVSAVLYGNMTLAAFIASGFTNALPGILLQLILVPVLVRMLQKVKV